MSQFTLAWSELYTAQTESVGAAIVATVTNLSGTVIASAKPAITTDDTGDPLYIDGSTAVGGGVTLQMLISDFSAAPEKNFIVTVNGPSNGVVLRILAADINHGVYYLKCGDPQAET